MNQWTVDQGADEILHKVEQQIRDLDAQRLGEGRRYLKIMLANLDQTTPKEQEKGRKIWLWLQQRNAL